MTPEEFQSLKNNRCRFYRDTLHGFTAFAPSPTMAWMLIRNKCVGLKKSIPTMDKIELDLNRNALHGIVLESIL